MKPDVDGDEGPARAAAGRTARVDIQKLSMNAHFTKGGTI